MENGNKNGIIKWSRIIISLATFLFLIGIAWATIQGRVSANEKLIELNAQEVEENAQEVKGVSDSVGNVIRYIDNINYNIENIGNSLGVEIIKLEPLID